MADFEQIKAAIMADDMNETYTKRGIEPLFKASKSATLVVVGQAPGQKAEESQLFWNDKSGDRLREWMGVDRETFYNAEKIAHLPMDFYYPGKAKTGDKAPRKAFGEKWHPILMDHMPQVESVILIGSHAQAFYLGKDRKKNLTETVRHYEEYLPEYFPLVHPSPLNFRWHAKNPWFEEEVVAAFRAFIQKHLRD